MLRIIKEHLKDLEEWRTFCLLDSSFDNIQVKRKTLFLYDYKIYQESENLPYYITEKVNGNPRGIEIELSSEGILRIIPYRYDVKHGQVISFYKNGSIISLTDYVDDMKHGFYIRYTPEGDIIQKLKLLNNVVVYF